jgi:predicted nucleic acid-binding protein
VRYWDSSAILPLLVEESETPRRRAQLREDSQIVTWWGSKVECASALNRLAREGALAVDALEQILDGLEILSSSWIETQATEKLRRRALRLLRVHSLHSADALQLAAALIACEEKPHLLTFLCSDRQLKDAAAKEGFPVL